ncbi:MULTISPECIES: hypothetical protein [Providencia]|uniref:Hemolysin XhlA n=2 Tax=Providencia TaxID=586 RepID=A0ABU2J0P1_9GAMM|nr:MULTISPECIES: hypothetical protein [Providencia]MDI7238725.1 hypothetical protein [Providencia huaxiensis]MDT0134892.1 hypothetical protein [Providencia huaxiensis]MDT1981297.1 hypothetical protein [Providencia huaxiensis]WPA91037.1 hypothetical protein QS795_011120 [Providencia sp. D4759]HEQ1859978.1 hypothetical protein [Providencia alcalifaciens]
MKKRPQQGRKKDVLIAINSQLNRIESNINRQMQSMDEQIELIREEATNGAIKRGYVAGAISGGVTACVVSTALILIRAKMGL